MSEPTTEPSPDVKFSPMEYRADDIGCQLLEPITKGLYADPKHVIREYVQNEVDSKPPAKEIHIKIDGRDISVWGNGAGMDAEDLNIARKIGFSTKDPRTDVGFRGIGIWSAVGYVNQVLISTKRPGTKKKLILKIDAKGLRKNIEKRSGEPLTKVLSENVSKADDWDSRTHSHYTHVRLVDAIDPRLLDPNGLLQYCRYVLPVGFDKTFPFKKEVETRIMTNVPSYKVTRAWVGKEEVFRPPFYSELDHPNYGTIKDQKNNTLAWYWVCFNKESRQISRDDSWGVVFKVKGFTVGDRNLTGPLFPGKSSLLAPWTVGEIHLITSDILPDAERTNFVSSDLREGLYASVRTVFEGFNEDVRKKSHLSNLRGVVAAVSKEKGPIVCNSEAEKAVRISELVDQRNKLKRGRAHKWTPASMHSSIDAGMDKIDKLLDTIKVKTIAGQAPSEQTQSGKGSGAYEHAVPEATAGMAKEREDEVVNSVLEVIEEVMKPTRKELETLKDKLRARLRGLIG